MVYSEHELNASGGSKLFACDWKPEGGSRAVICVVHGLGEHCGRYAQLADFMAHEGFSTVSFDLRGHGRSPGKRGHIPSYETLMDDIASFESDALERFPGKPVILYGHSLGGNLVLNYALRRNTRFLGVIATGPWLRLVNEPSGLKRRLAFIMDVILPGYIQSNGLDAKALSHSTELEKRYRSDPLVHGLISVRLFAGAYKSGLWALDHASEFKLPLLLMHGGEDRITSPDASRVFAESAGEKCTLKIWDGMYHEIHNESQKDEVFRFTSDWLNLLMLK